MERELWPLLYRALRAVSAHDHQPQVQYQPWEIVAVLLWAALHDRPRCWACDPRHWDTTDLRADQPPSPATVSRRARSARVLDLLDRLGAHLRGGGPPGWTLMVDGKPLPVGKCSKDPDALPNQHGKGYKLHTVWGFRCGPEAWAVTAVNEYEGTVAERLIGALLGKGVLLGDKGYDASRLYDAAWRSGYLLLVPPSATDTGRGHVYQSPARQLARSWFADGLGAALWRARAGIERAFGNLGAFGGGLGPLPSWVRRLWRVQRWVQCKLLINAVRILRKQQQMQPMK